MMRRTASLLLLLSLVATGAAPLAGERLVCPMPMSSKGDATPACAACAMDAPANAASLEAASCCTMAPATVAEAVPATVTAQRRGGITTDHASVVVADAPILCFPVSQYVPSFDTPPPVPSSSPPPLSTQTTHLRN